MSSLPLYLRIWLHWSKTKNAGLQISTHWRSSILSKANIAQKGQNAHSVTFYIIYLWWIQHNRVRKQTSTNTGSIQQSDGEATTAFVCKKVDKTSSTHRQIPKTGNMATPPPLSKNFGTNLVQNRYKFEAFLDE